MRGGRAWWAPLLGHVLLFLGVYQLGYTPDEWAQIKRSAVERGISQKEAIREANGAFGFVKIYYLTDSDERLYREYARLTLDGEVDLPFVLGKKYMTQARPLPARPWPYRDVQVEYPPGMLLGTLPPALLADSYRGYRFWLAAWMGAVYLLNVWLAVRVMWPQAAQASPQARAQVWGRALWWSLGFCALLGNLLVTRLDHLATLWILACLWAAQRALRGERGWGWAAAAGVAAGLGVWTKVVPAVALGGPWMVYLWPAAGQGRRWGLWGASAAGLVASVAGLNLGSYALLGEGYWDTYTYHTDRGVQLESLWAGVILVAHQWGYPAQMDLSFGSANVASGATGFVQAASPLAFAALVGAVWAAHLRRRPVGLEGEALQVGWAASALLMAFVLANKVFSPQYLLWFGPLWVGLIAAMGQGGEGGARRWWGPGGLLLGAALLSQVMYPRGYEVLKSFHPAMVAVLNARNALVVALWVALLWALGRAESPWRPK